MRLAGLVLLVSPVLGCSASGRVAPAPVAGPTGTVIVSNMNDHTVTLVDAATGAVRATLPTGIGPHEVAASHDGRWAAVSNYGVRGQPGRTITVIDVAAASVARTIDLMTHQRPHGMAFLPGDSLLLVTSERSQAVLVVDFRSGQLRATRATRGRASHMLAVDAMGRTLVTANIADGTVSWIAPLDTAQARVYPAARQGEGVAVSPDGARIWVGSNRDSLVVVLNAATGAPIDTLRGFGLPYRLAASPNGEMVVITDPARGEIGIFDAVSRRLRFTIKVPGDSLVSTAEVPGSPSPEGVAITSDSRWAFVTLQGRNRVATIDLLRGVIVAYAPTGVWSDGVAWSPVRGAASR